MLKYIKATLTATAVCITFYSVAPAATVTIDPRVPAYDYDADNEQAIEDMLNGQVATLSKGKRCSNPEDFDGIPATLLVRNAEGKDTGVVRVVTFDEGYAAVTNGEVWILKACA